MNFFKSLMWVVFRKEVKENLRDHRAVLSSLVMGAMVGPLVFAAMINFMIKQQNEWAEQELVIPVVGQARAPNLVDWLQRQGAKVEDAPADPEMAVQSRDLDLVLVIPDNYAEQWQQGQPAALELIVDRSRREANTTIARVQGLVLSWGQQVGSLRLRARGVNPLLTSPILVNARDVSTPESRGSSILAMWPYFLMLSVFVGGMYLAIDATAGERERQSMEPLLLNPIGASQVVNGKMLATACFGVLALVLTLLMFKVGVRFLPTEALGIRLNMGLDVLVHVLLIMLPVAALAAGLQTLVAAFSKGFREAQTYLSFLVFIPAVPSVWMAVAPIKPELWMMFVPLLNQSVQIHLISRGETIAMSWQLIAWVLTAIVAMVISQLARVCYQRPAIISH